MLDVVASQHMHTYSGVGVYGMVVPIHLLLMHLWWYDTLRMYLSVSILGVLHLAGGIYGYL